MKHFLPSTRMIVWGLVLGIVAIALYNNVSAIQKVAGPRT